jgi:hypothetical protein
MNRIPETRLRQMAARLHTLGPRALYEFLRSIISGDPIVDTLEDYERLDPAILKYLGGYYLADTEEIAQ